MHRWPQSLFGRLWLFFMAGLILVQCLSAAIVLYDRGEVFHRALGGNIAQRIGNLVSLLDSLPTGERWRVVTALDLPPARISLDQPWREAISDDSSEVLVLVALLRRALPPGRPLRVEVDNSDAPATPPPPPAERPPGEPPHWRYARYARWLGATRGVLVQVKLQDGTVVTFRQRLPEEVFDWPYRLLALLLVLLVSVAALAGLAVRWFTRPLATLAQAATELGRDIHRPPLAETGSLEVRQAARAFNTMQTRLRRYIEDRDRVLAAISHDLKTPITRLKLRAELLEDAGLQAKWQADLEAMEAMVQATLDFMRGSEHKEPVVPVDIIALLESLQADAHETGAEVSVAGKAHAPYPGRPLALRRCLGNLVDNALHYGGRAMIEIDDQPTRLLLRVRDAGPGIPDAQLERVFEPFYRLEGSRSRNTGGTGLGLGIARNIARAHGGELTLRNHPQGGLEATLELPR